MRIRACVWLAIVSPKQKPERVSLGFLFCDGAVSVKQMRRDASLASSWLSEQIQSSSQADAQTPHALPLQKPLGSRSHIELQYFLR